MDEIFRLLAAASRVEDRALRLIYTAEARIRLDEARLEVEQADTLLRAAEAEIVRVEGLAG
ncbi:MAG: hypothetical protein U0169_02025 [Polyangiaceae bacterium]